MSIIYIIQKYANNSMEDSPIRVMKAHSFPSLEMSTCSSEGVPELTAEHVTFFQKKWISYS
jgi:hypothetical protein